MSDTFGKGDGLGVVADHQVLARELQNVLSSLRTARNKLRKSDAASIPVRDALKAGEKFEKHFKLTRPRLDKLEKFILGLTRFADKQKLKGKAGGR